MRKIIAIACVIDKVKLQSSQRINNIMRKDHES